MHMDDKGKVASHAVYDDPRPLNSYSLVLGREKMQQFPLFVHNPRTRMLRLVLDSSAQLLLNDFMTLEGSRIDKLLDGICEPLF